MGVGVGHGDVLAGAVQRIRHFEIRPASRDLAGTPPGGSWIATEGVVEPLGYFVGQGIDICCGAEAAGGIEIGDGVGLHSAAKAGVVEV